MSLRVIVVCMLVSDAVCLHFVTLCVAFLPRFVCWFRFVSRVILKLMSEIYVAGKPA